jgi:esterase/lipase superfamily enzyme
MRSKPVLMSGSIAAIVAVNLAVMFTPWSGRGFAQEKIVLATPNPELRPTLEDLRRAIDTFGQSKLTVSIAEPPEYPTYPRLAKAVRENGRLAGMVPLSLAAPEPDDPLFNYARVPGLIPGFGAARRIDTLMRPVLRERTGGLRILLTSPGIPWGLFARAEIKSLKDLKDRRLAAFSSVAKSFSDQVEAKLVASDRPGFERAVEDGSADYLVAPATLVYRKWPRLGEFKFYYPAQVFMPMYAVVINDSYVRKALGPEQQSVLRIAALATEQSAWRRTATQTAEAIRALASAGIRVIDEALEMRQDLSRVAGVVARNTFSALHLQLTSLKYDNAPATRCWTIPVYFATNRASVASAGSRLRFGHTPATVVSYGRADVAVPWRGSTPPNGVGATCRHGIPEDPRIEGVTGFTSHAYVDAVKKSFADARSKGRTVPPAFYVHGFANDFDDAVLLAAGLAEVLDRNAPVALLYSWPSEGSLVEYFADEKRVQTAYEPLSSAFGINRIALGRFSFIAHSMGNRALAAALERLSQNDLRSLDGVALFAPDVSIQAYVGARKGLGVVGRTSAVYASDNDLALSISKLLHPGEWRVGLLTDHTHDVTPAELIDVSVENRELLGHSYGAIEPAVVRDMKQLISSGKSAQARGLHPKTRSGYQVYTLRP